MLGIFFSVALLISVYELLQRLLFEGARSPWLSYSITIGVIAALATAASFMLRQWAVKIYEQIRIAAIAFETQEGMMVTDATGTILKVNQAFTHITGYSSQDTIGQNPRMLKSSRHDQDFYTAMWHSVGETGEWKGEVWSRRKNGEVYPEYLNISAVKDQSGQVTNYVAMLTDISERKQAEQQADALIQRNQILMNTALEGIHILDETGKVIEANNAFCEHLGYTQSEILQLSVFDFEAAVPPDELKQNIQKLLNSHAVFESVHRRKDGSLVDVELSISGAEQAGKKYLLALCRDITDRKKADDKIKRMAFYDPLTGLANRRLMTDRMEQSLAHARRSGELVAICMIDLDGFKQVNDHLGHKAGDELLIEVAKRLHECVREADTASRFGGDEFALILAGFKKIGECEQSLNRIIASLGAPYLVSGEIAHVTGSIGVTIFPNDGGTSDLLLRHADQAMYEAKQAGKNRYHLFNPSHQDQQQANQTTLKRIEKALTTGQLILLYQPQVDCRSGKVIGVEALIRWDHPVLGMLAPSEFIPLIEHDDLIITVGEWVIKEAMIQLAAWRSAGFDLTVGVNVSARQLHQSNFIERLNGLLVDYPPDVISHLEIEILETTALEDVKAVAEAIRECRALGIHVALDNFGTGFSSLAHLKQLPVDVLKIDQSFIFGMLHNPSDYAIVSGIVGLASSFNRKVIAEGVESIDHVLMLLNLGCNLMQGYVIARPMQAERIASWVGKFEPDPLWQLSSTELPSRDHFELLLAEATHRHWIAQLLENLCEPQETADPELLLDHQKCRFGLWYYGSGARQFGSESWFHSIEPIHRQLHQTAGRLCENRRARNTSASEINETELKTLQNELDQQMSNLRNMLAKKYLSNRSE